MARGRELKLLPDRLQRSLASSVSGVMAASSTKRATYEEVQLAKRGSVSKTQASEDDWWCPLLTACPCRQLE